MRKLSLIFFLLTSFCFSLLAQQENMSEGFEVFDAATKLPEGWIAYTKEGTRPFAVVKDPKYGVPNARTEKCYVTSTSNPPRYDNPKVSATTGWYLLSKVLCWSLSLSLWAKSKDTLAAFLLLRRIPVLGSPFICLNRNGCCRFYSAYLRPFRFQIPTPSMLLICLALSLG